MKLEVGKQYKAAWPDRQVFTIIGQHPVSKLFLSACGEHTYIYTFDEDGYGVNTTSNLTEEYIEPRVRYVNVYENDRGDTLVSKTFYTREDADISSKYCAHKRIACIKMVEGQFDD